MKIGIVDGTISFESGQIRRTLNRRQFLESTVGRESKERLVNQDWKHYHIEPEPGIAGTVLFKADRIDRVLLMMRIPSDSIKEWTEERELERKAAHDRWLLAELGIPPYEYAWGRVASEFDPRGLASEIIVVYDR
jgi:hypothetical protein